MKFFVLIFMVCSMLSCSMHIDTSSSDSDQTLISVINWNLQTFFDATTVGTEYEDFRGSKSNWTQEKYVERLKKLCSFIETTQADVYVFQEIENSSILQDISNELVALRSIKKGYGFSAFSKNNEEALGIAILSRFPLFDINVHHIDYRTALKLFEFENSSTVFDGSFLEQPSMRALLHAKVMVNETAAFSLYTCHWKSKSGGAEKSEVWRNAQERLLAEILIKEKNEFLVTGDFNRTLEEFMHEENNTISKNEILLQGIDKTKSVISSWLEYKATSAPGSYFYQGEWEKIDHFFYSEGLEVVDFQTIKNEISTTVEGLPYRYNVYSGTGSSDHLPLLCVVEL